MNLRGLILLGVAGFVAGLLLLAPVATLHGWLKSKNPSAPYQLYGLQGTLDEGRLAGLQFGGRPALNDLHWQWQPWWLLLGRASFHLDGGGNQAIVDGAFSVSPIGTLRLRNFLMTGSVKPLLAAVGQAFLPMEGQVRMDLKSLKLRDGLPKSVEGNVQFQGLAWTLAREPILLGDYRADLSTENGDNLLKIASTSGPLELSGSGKFAQDQSYELDLRLKPKPEASPMLRNLVGSSGAPDLEGWYRIRKSGKLVK